MVRAVGFEPTRSFEHRHLKPACLPFHHARIVAIVPPKPSPRYVGRAAYLEENAERRGQRVRSAEEFEAAMRLIASGANASAVARQLGIPRSTVRDWRNKPQIASRHTRESECGVVHDFSVLPPAAYSYVLGLYLGDGNISRTRRVWRLRITLDKSIRRLSIGAVTPSDC